MRITAAVLERLCAAAGLKPATRETLRLRYAEGVPDADIAAQLGVSLITVRTRAHRAAHKIRDALFPGGEVAFVEQFLLGNEDEEPEDHERHRYDSRTLYEAYRNHMRTDPRTPVYGHAYEYKGVLYAEESAIHAAPMSYAEFCRLLDKRYY
jgi:predicted DNA-binding protein (UPF0251 family)